MSRLFVPCVGFVVVVAGFTASIEASHIPQRNGPVTTRIVEDVWGSPEHCFPCYHPGTNLYQRTLRVETSEGVITELRIRVDGELHQVPRSNDLSISELLMRRDIFSLTRDIDSHFLFEKRVDRLDVVYERHDPIKMDARFGGFVPFGL